MLHNLCDTLTLTFRSLCWFFPITDSELRLKPCKLKPESLERRYYRSLQFSATDIATTTSFVVTHTSHQHLFDSILAIYQVECICNLHMSEITVSQSCLSKNYFYHLSTCSWLIVFVSTGLLQA